MILAGTELSKDDSSKIDKTICFCKRHLKKDRLDARTHLVYKTMIIIQIEIGQFINHLDNQYDVINH